jgi:hypothetical protein
LRPAQGSLELFASVVNYGETDHTTLFSIEIDGALAFTQELFLTPGETKDLSLSKLPLATRIVKAYLSPSGVAGNQLDVFDLDNTAFAINQESKQKNIYLLTQDYVTHGEANFAWCLERLKLSAPAGPRPSSWPASHRLSPTASAIRPVRTGWVLLTPYQQLTLSNGNL